MAVLSFVWLESMNGEVWKEIEGLDSRYFVSTDGRVLSLCMDGYKLMQGATEIRCSLFAFISTTLDRITGDRHPHKTTMCLF